MAIFRKYLLLCTLIVLFGRNAARSFLHQDVFARDADFWQANDNDDGTVDYRLPSSVKPTSYEIIIIPDLQTTFTFKGFLKIQAKVLHATKTVTLNVGNLQIISNSVASNNTNLYETDSYDDVTEKWTITLSKTLKEGSEIIIAFEYEGTLNDNMIGLYRSSYEDRDGRTRWLAATQFAPMYARHAFPCFDEPGYKATFKIRILRDQSHTCLSNMPLIGSEGKDKIWDTFEESIPMPTYLVAFVITDFYNLTRDIFNVWTRPIIIDQANYALEIGNTALGILSESLQQKYPLSKMDMVALPDLSYNAMENWGLVTYRESCLFYDEDDSTALAQQNVASVIVHELAHMWFGNLVTPEWWSCVWLSEGFATYFQYFVTAKIEETWHMKEQFVLMEHQSALMIDALESSRSLTRNVSSHSQIVDSLDSITYSKGASIVRMMSHMFGADIFEPALSDYLKENKVKGLGSPDSLWKVFQNHADRKPSLLSATVKEIMNTWTKQPGYPVVSVTVSNDGVLHVSQHRFFLRNLNNASTDSTWLVPLTWTTQSALNFKDTTTKYWLSNKKDTVNLQLDPKEWVIFNVQSSGFYRVNYNLDGWKRISSVLNSRNYKEIHMLNRAAIVDDLLNLGRTGYQSYETVFNGITYLKQETNYLPFKAAFDGLSYLDKRFAGHEEEHSLFKKYLISLIDKRRKELGYEDRINDDRLTVLLRQEVNKWACNYGDKECIAIYLDKFQMWQENPYANIESNERATTYCVAIRNGTFKDWQFLWWRYQNSDNAADQQIIGRALGCTLDTGILEWYLKLAISGYQDSKIRKQDSASVFSAVYSSGLTGAEYILDFVDKHYDDIVKYYGEPSQVAKILDGASRRFSTRRLVDRFESLIDTHREKFTPILKSLEYSLKVAKYELEWYKKSSGPIVRWLQAYHDEKEKTVPIITTTPLPDEDMTKYRLPEDINPTNYTIFVTPRLDPKFTFEGSVIINAKVMKPTKQIVLHSEEIDHYSVSVTKDNHVNVEIASKSKEDKYSFYVIELVEELAVNTNLEIKIDYGGRLTTSELRGFYKSSYVDKDGATRWLATTQLEPVAARKMFPCFDEPAMKAFFNVRVCAPSGYHAISNMGAYSSKYQGDDCQWFTFPKSEKMSTYLVAVVVSDFASKSTERNKYTVYARPNAIDQTEFALSVMSPLVDFFEAKFGLQYPISKLDMVALPDFPASAMENWGLLTYKETSLLYDKNNSLITSWQAIRNVIAHEIAHQWFGNLVTPNWWKHVWLSEGFGRYFQYHAVALAFKDTTLESQFVVDHVHSALNADSSSSTHAMTHDVYRPDDIRDIFDKISYAKAASILRMVEKSYGSVVFYDALKKYLDKWYVQTVTFLLWIAEASPGNPMKKYKATTPENLYEAFQMQINTWGWKDNIEDILNTWTTQPGYPVLHVDIQKEIVTLKQERFLLKRYSGNSVDVEWYIPITIASWDILDYRNTTPIFWMKEKEEKINLTDYNIKQPQVLTVNVQQSGFYRVNYNKDNWLRLIGALKIQNNDNSIHVINRAALIDDLMNLARADYIDYQLVISATEYLRGENNYLPWRAFYNNLPYLDKRFRGRDIEGLYKKYLVSLVKPLYDTLGFYDENSNEDNSMNLSNMLRIYTREWACKLDIPDCRFYAAKYFQEKYNSKPMPPNYRGVVYCTAMRTEKTNITFDFLWKEYLNNNVTTDKLVILTSLTCSQDKYILERLLLNTIAESSYVRFQDSAKVFSDVCEASLTGVEVVMDVIQNYYDDLYRHFGGYAEIKKIVSSLATKLSTHDLYQQYENLLKWLTGKKLESKEEIDSYLSKAQYEFDWYDKQAPEIFEGIDKLIQDDTYRLPNTLYPMLYDIYLTPDIEERKFKGEEQIYLKVEKDTTSVVLNAHNIVIEDIKVYRDDKADSEKEIPISNFIIDSNTQQLKIYLKEYVKVKKIMLAIKFNGILNDDMHGFYRSSYLDDDEERHWLATTQFEATYAREAFPCFDEPAFKSYYIINIQRLKHYNALSNMPLEENTLVKDSDYVWDKFQKTTEPMSTYLVAFVVSEFTPLNNSAFINVWGRPDVTQYGYYAKNLAESFISTLENFTNITYPLPKLDLIGIPDFNMGAMENWGLITFREYGLFYDKSGTTSALEKYLITVVAHELAHTWFGNFVTCQWWDYIWLHEGFAEYLQWVAADAVLPEYKFMDQFVVYELQAALTKDSSYTTQPMTRSVKTAKEINDIFDYVSYEKSASVLRMLFNAFDNVYELALQDYLKNHKGGTARPADLWDSFEKHASISVDGRKLSIAEVMETWTNQPGYPVVHARMNDSKLTLSQERFLISATGNENDESRKNGATEFYWIPIHIETSSIVDVNYINLNSDLWLGPEPTTVFVNPNNEWFLVNYKQTGFYRVNYDTDSWIRLIALLNNNQFMNIHTLSRAQIMDDLYNLARADYVNYTLWLDASKYLVHESNHLPWKAFFNGFSYIYERFEEESDKKHLNDYILYLTSSIYKKLKLKDLDTDQHLDGLQREMILQWACTANNLDCVNRSVDQFAIWRKKPQKRVPRNERPAVYCTAIKKGSPKEWDFLWEQYLQTNFASEQKVIINALGCSTNKKVLYNYLMKVISTAPRITIRKQDASTVFAAVYSSSQLGVNVTLDFLRDNLHALHTYFGNWDEVRTLCSNAASHISTAPLYFKLKNLFALDRDIFPHDFTYPVIEKVRHNLDWYTIYSEQIIKWMIEKNPAPSSGCTITPTITFMSLLALIPYFLNNH